MDIFKSLSMRSKLITLTISSVVLSSTILIFALERISESALTNQIVSNLTALVSSKSSEVELTMQTLSKQVESLSNSKFVQDALVSYESVAYGTGLDLDSDADISKSPYFKTIEVKYKESLEDSLQALPLESFALVLNGGFVVSETGRSGLLGKNLLNGTLNKTNLSTCFKSALKNNSHFSELTSIDGYSGFFICRKITSKYDRDGYQKNSLMGVLVATIKWSLLSQLAQFDKGMGQTGQIFVTDGTTLISPPRELKDVPSLAELKNKEINFSLEYPDKATYGLGKGFKNEDIIFVYSNIKPSENNNWKMIGQISREEAFSSIYSLVKWSLILLAVGLLITSAVSFLIINSISRNFSVANIKVSHSSEDVSIAMNEVSEISTKISESTHQQSSALEETASAMEEINSMVNRTLELSKSSADNSLICSNRANEGSQRMDDLVLTVAKMGNSTDHSLLQIKSKSGGALNEALQAFITIESKTKVINEIAFQTKLLSFNASVEAARAGEHGKGFSVVAEEVGQLAMSVNKSAKEIDDFLSTTSSKLKEVIDSSLSEIDHSIISTREHVKISKSAAESGLSFFKELSDIVQTIQSESSAVFSAAEEQAKGISEVNKAVSEITQSNYENSLQVNKLQSLTANMKNTSENLAEASGNMSNLLKGVAKKNPASFDNKVISNEAVEENVIIKAS